MNCSLLIEHMFDKHMQRKKQKAANFWETESRWLSGDGFGRTSNSHTWSMGSACPSPAECPQDTPIINTAPVHLLSPRFLFHTVFLSSKLTLPLLLSSANFLYRAIINILANMGILCRSVLTRKSSINFIDKIQNIVVEYTFSFLTPV